MTQRWIAALAAVFLCAGAAAQTGTPSNPPWLAASPWPDRVIVTLEQDPTTSFSVTWRTDTSVAETRAELVEARPDSRFDLGAETVPAVSETVDLSRKEIDGETHALGWNADLADVRYHSATITGLRPDTLYAYRVMGAEEHWSEWMQTRTAPASGEPFKFLYFGDAQDGIGSHWPRVVRGAFQQAPGARFAIHAGDLVNYGSRDFEWAAWFEAVGFIHGMIPALPIPGNHEYFDALRDPEGGPINALSLLWRPQFTLPRSPSLPEDLQETVYAVRYGSLLLLTLDSMAAEHFEAQAEWLDAQLAASTADWHIVTTHHPLFDLVDRSYGDENGPERRSLFLPILRRHAVDLVLQGHDHSYGRGTLSATRGGGPSAEQAAELVSTVFVTSAASAKSYETRDDGWESFAELGVTLERRAENTQFFQVIDIDGDSLTYEAFTATGERYDAFRIEKSEGGANRIVGLATDIREERMMENTGEYRGGRFDVLPTR